MITLSDFKKSVVEDYEARIGEYTSASAYAREKGIPDNTLLGWLKKATFMPSSSRALR